MVNKKIQRLYELFQQQIFHFDTIEDMKKTLKNDIMKFIKNEEYYQDLLLTNRQNQQENKKLLLTNEQKQQEKEKRNKKKNNFIIVFVNIVTLNIQLKY